MNQPDVKGRVLVVDDELRNRRLLRGILEAQGHEVMEADSGDSALAQMTVWQPDVVLLDVMMPGMNGFEVCRILKSTLSTEHIPVLMVTALTERRDRLGGISAGANDFITKPIDTDEVVLRVRNAVRSKQIYDRLQESFAQIQMLEGLRANLTHMIVHDLRSPLAGIMGNLELLLLDDEEEPLPPSIKQTIDRALRSTTSMVDMVSSLLDVSRLEEGKMPLDREDCSLAEVAQAAADRLGAPMEGRSVRIESPPGLHINCDSHLIGRVIANLLGNGLKYAPPHTEVVVSIEPGESEVSVSVTDQGPGIPAEHHGRIFEKFGQAEGPKERKKHSSGLGLTFCKLAVEAHGGRIGVESGKDRGSRFWFTLPRAPGNTTGS